MSGPRGSWLGTKLYYGFGSVAYGVKDNGFSYFLLLYYNQVLGLPAEWVGAAIMLSLVFDAFSDPVVGYVSDNLHSRWGRRHPLMYASVLPVAVSYLLLWNPPAGLERGALFTYLLVVAILVRTFITLYEIPSSSLVAELTDDYDERTSMLSYRYFFGWWGGLTMALIAYFVLLRSTPEYPVGQLNPIGWRSYGWVASSVIVFAILVSAVGTHRHIPYLKRPPHKQPFSARRTARELGETLSNRSFLVLFFSAIFGAMAAGLITSLNIYFNTYFWELTPSQIGVLTLGPFISSVVALVAAPILSRRIGKKIGAVLIGSLAACLAPAPIVGRLVGLMPPNGSPALVPTLFVFDPHLLDGRGHRGGERAIDGASLRGRLLRCAQLHREGGARDRRDDRNPASRHDRVPSGREARRRRARNRREPGPRLRPRRLQRLHHLGRAGGGVPHLSCRSPGEPPATHDVEDSARPRLQREEPL
jgi:hypothetical protein